MNHSSKKQVKDLRIGDVVYSINGYDVNEGKVTSISGDKISVNRQSRPVQGSDCVIIDYYYPEKTGFYLDKYDALIAISRKIDRDKIYIKQGINEQIEKLVGIRVIEIQHIEAMEKAIYEKVG